MSDNSMEREKKKVRLKNQNVFSAFILGLSLILISTN